ncbi:ATP-binding protein, partial [Enterococcus faecalis]|nr:ATP-binding protein [Enterococcus faecalis]
FENTNVNHIFGNYNLQDFLEFNKEEEKKLIIIDSAERLLDLKNLDVFKEFFLTLKKHGWTFIFTARSSYLSDLSVHIIDQYNTSPIKYYIEELNEEELENYSTMYDFSVPQNSKMFELLRNPFYLNEYLNLYTNGEAIEYQAFKEKIWDKVIKKSKPQREQCFLGISLARVSEGHFFVLPNFDQKIIDSLVNDGILGYEVAGYFITHDIYEEWALEKIIESEFVKCHDYHTFFNSIGDYLPIRRSFRKWLSDKLLLEDVTIKTFIEEVFEDPAIPTFWKDEILVSVLLSDYSDIFFSFFKEDLIVNNFELLKKIFFLLRVACKEVDESNLKLIQSSEYSISYLKYIFTVPKGKGWETAIKFVCENGNIFEPDNLNVILPVLTEWNNKFKIGETTKLSANFALRYYELFSQSKERIDGLEDIKKNLIKIIISGSSEIKDELSSIFEKILDNKWRDYRDPYYDLVTTILIKPAESTEILAALPEYVLKLANLYWCNQTISNENEVLRYGFRSSSVTLEESFGIDSRYHHKYFPSSAIQTPIFWLLNIDYKKTIDFIIDFTNRMVESYVSSGLDENGIQDISLQIGEKEVKQFANDRLWNAYRGTAMTPYLFESIHMALEKFLLQVSPNTDGDILENNLLYLLKYSNSASITSVVTSIVLANPDKTFNVATILFKTKEIFFLDTGRFSLDSSSPFGFLSGLNPLIKAHENERSKSNSVQHRKQTLQLLVLSYQMFRDKSTSEEEAENRRDIIWSIIDDYYKKVEDEEEANNKTWRMYLARMDRRKLTPNVKETEEGVEIHFETELDEDLEAHRMTITNESNKNTKYLSLKLWAQSRLEKTEHDKYLQYDKNPKRALKEVKEVLEEFKLNNPDFFLYSYGVPGLVCTVLVGEYFEELSDVEQIFCKDVIIECASSSLREGYDYQIADGVESSISVLPIIFEKFPEERNTIKKILFSTLFDSNRLGAYASFSDFPAKAISSKLWGISYPDALSLLIGFLKLKPKYNEMISQFNIGYYKPDGHQMNYNELMEIFTKEYNEEFQKVIDNSITLDNFSILDKMDFQDLLTAFKIIPLKNDEELTKEISLRIIVIISKKLMSTERFLEGGNEFLEEYTKVVLSSSEKDIQTYLKPFLTEFKNVESMSDLFRMFIVVEDRMKTYQKFWIVWDIFYDKVIGMAEKGSIDNNSKKVIKSYLFASTSWNEEAQEWEAFSDEKKRFFKQVAQDLGKFPIVLYAFCVLLNGVGQIYLVNGIKWISEMISSNSNLWNEDLEVNTVYLLEKLMKEYIYKNREKIKRNVQLKKEVLVILEFLVEKGSVAGYMLRENIL